MSRRGTSEPRLVGALSSLFGGADASAAALVGIGDDAAVLRRRPGRLVWTVDTSVERVHFTRRLLSFENLGERSFHAAVSDIAAMAASPAAALSSLILPPGLGERAILAIGRGQARAAQALSCPIVGGNLSRGSELSVTTTVVGYAKSPLERSGAKPGDEVWLLGEVGLAGAGLRLLEARKRPATAVTRRAFKVCVAAWRAPRALVVEGRRLSGKAHAAIDVSDGLGIDAGRIADASRVAVTLEEAALRSVLCPELLVAAEALGVEPLELALSGGEDYALVATGPPKLRPRSARRIGRVEPGASVRLETPGGVFRTPPGFDHFGGR